MPGGNLNVRAGSPCKGPLAPDLLGLSCVGPWALARTIWYVTKSGPLIKLRTGSMILRLNHGKFWINIVISEEALSNCLGLLHVAHYLLFTVTSFLAMPINSLAV